MPERIGPRRPVRVYLAAWREHLGLTQQQIGNRIAGGIDKGTVSRWENAKRVPSVNVLGAYAEALGVPIASLFRPPDSGPNLDELVAGAPAELKKKAEEVIRIIVKAGN